MSPSEIEEQSDDPSAGGILSEIRGGGEDGDLPAGLDLSTAKVKQRVSMSNVVIALVLVVSAGSLYLMRKQGKGAGMTFQVSAIDYELERAGKNDSEQQRILTELARTGKAMELHMERISKNPFQLDTENATPVPIFDSDADRRKRADQERERRQRELSARLAGLELNGIMGGNVPLARIGGQTVRTGDTVAEMFVVQAIHPETRSVDLVVDGQVHTLTMNEGQSTRRPGMRRP